MLRIEKIVQERRDAADRLAAKLAEEARRRRERLQQLTDILRDMLPVKGEFSVAIPGLGQVVVRTLDTPVSLRLGAMQQIMDAEVDMALDYLLGEVEDE